MKSHLIVMAIKSTSKKSISYIQSCITSVSFPDTINGVLTMVERNKPKVSWSTDLDILLNFKNTKPLFWTAPKWLTKGDIIFFYHTKRAKSRTAKLFTEAQQKFPHKRNLIKLLKHAKETADLYSGNIFGCALVSSGTQLFDKQEKHFISRLFAPLEKVHIFEKPLHQELFADCVKIGLNTITPLYKKEFNGIRKLLSKQNKIPNFLQNTALGDNVFKNINASNWRSISCIPNIEFIHEAQLRAYLLDFFLNEIKDKGSPILEECECFCGDRNTGRVDYFIKIFGQWIPVEAKLNISKERDIFAQTAKYTNINVFSPRKGSYRNKVFVVNPIPLCLVFDQLGIYLISKTGKFINSGFNIPNWKREQYTKRVGFKIREEVKKITE
jgi:hypothetical protein